MAERKPARFVIDDKPYAIPTLDTINLDEERILFIYADTVVRDFMPVHPEGSVDDKRVYEWAQASKYRNPAFKRALAHIAYRRENPELGDEAIEKIIGQVNAFEVDLAVELAGDEDPSQDSQKQHEKPSESQEPMPPSSSGSPTQKSSDPAEESQVLTGTTELGTSSPGVPRIELVS